MVNIFGRGLYGVLLASMLWLSGCSFGYNPERNARLAGPPPQPQREFRGVWVATVANIDWPSQPGLSAAAQQAELIALFDRVASLNMNAVILQVRPAADALYASEYEPWSWYLTGEMGKPPQPYYDPLAFAVEEAHRRGLELHAWFNPFRAGHRTYSEDYAPNHIKVLRPDLVVEYGQQYWMDPGMAEAREHSLRVMLDVVRRYDIDGIHMDDYFYPYPVQDENGQEIAFPDTLSRQRAGFESRGMTVQEWRRGNINRFVETLYHEVKREKPWIKVGLSPFGIWRPGNPEGIRGFDAYDKLYADARLWLQRGWIDYLSPQLYWSIDSDGQSYPRLLEWWQAQNTEGRYVWPGNAIYRIDSHNWPVTEVLNQIELTRGRQNNTGNVLFSMRILKNNVKGIGDHMRREVYNRPALVPGMPWLYEHHLEMPAIAIEQKQQGEQVLMENIRGEDVLKWIIRIRLRSRWYLFVEPGAARTFSTYTHFGNRPVDEVIVSYVNRLGQESPMASWSRAMEARVAIGF